MDYIYGAIAGDNDELSIAAAGFRVIGDPMIGRVSYQDKINGSYARKRIGGLVSW